MKDKEYVYVCYVLNCMGLLDGEETVSSLIVTKSQDKVDVWLKEQLKEAEENGYKPEESVSDFFGYVDYSLPVSKGNEKDGYDTYYFICETKLVQR